MPTSSRPGRWLREVLRRMEVDRTVSYAISSRVWQLFAGPVTLLLIAHFFSRAEQGYYYTFWNLLALQTCFELSLQQVIINFASHEWERLGLATDRSIEGDQQALSRLASLLRGSLVWYAAAGVSFFVLVGGLGLVFFRAAPGSEAVAWQLPWLWLVGLTAATFGTIPLLAILEGCNQVRQVYKYQLLRAVLGNAAVWTAIPLGAALWTPMVAAAVRLVVDLLLVAGTYRRFFGQLLNTPSGSLSVDWWREVWPFQWRVGLRGLLAYFNNYLITPIVFFYHGDVVAGQVGMTWQILTALWSASSAWVQTRAARFGMLVSRAAYVELDRAYFRLTAISLGVMAVLSAAFCLFVQFLYSTDSRFASRLMEPWPTAVLGVGVTLSLLSTCQWIYLHAHKRSPYVRLTAIGSAASALLIWWCGRTWGATGVALAYTGVMAGYYLPVWTWVWHRCRIEWHQPDAAVAAAPSPMSLDP